FSPDGQLFVTRGGERYPDERGDPYPNPYFCWDTRTARQVRSDGASSPVTFLPDGRLVCRLRGRPAEHQIVEPRTGKVTRRFTATGVVVGVDRTGQLALVAEEDRAWLVSTDTGERVSLVLAHSGRLASTGLTPDGRQVLLVGKGQAR